MALTSLTKVQFEEIAKDVLRWPAQRIWETKKDERFSSCFGTPSTVVAKIWNRILPAVLQDQADGYQANGAQPKHLLWSLVFLKVYSTEAIHCSIVGWPDRNVYRKWCWYFLKKISDLRFEVILLENRFQGLGPSTTQTCFLSVDGIDCPVLEPYPFDGKWYSHKFNGPAVKYELGVCINTGHICWMKGPFRGGKGDSTIFKEGLSTILPLGEGVEVDSGYQGNLRSKLPLMANNSRERREKSVVRGRHENVNGRLKTFNVLDCHFRHLNPGINVVGNDERTKKMLEKHKLCFFSVAVITQLKFEAGEKIYDVAYDVIYYS
jgi:hypothetical protein